MNIREMIDSAPAEAAVLVFDLSTSPHAAAIPPPEHRALAVIEPHGHLGCAWSLADVPGASRRELVTLAARILSSWCGGGRRSPASPAPDAGLPPVPEDEGPTGLLPMWSFILSLYVDGAPVPPEHYLGTEADVRAWRVWLRALGQRDAPVSEDPFFVSLFGGSGRPYPTDVPVLVPLRRPHVPAARLLPILTAVVECAKLTLASAHMHRAISIGVVGDAAAVELVGRALACADRAPELPILLHEEPLELGFPETPDSLNRQRDCTFALPVFRPDPLGALMQGARGWCLADALDHQEGGHDAPPYVAELRAADVAPGCLLPLLELPDSLVDM